MAMIPSAKRTGKNNNTIEREKKNNTITAISLDFFAAY